MFDTIHLYLPEDRVSSTDLLAQTPLYLENITELNRSGQYVITGSMNNLKVTVSERGVSIKGSLAKYYLNDNIQTLTRQDTEEAVSKLSDEIHLPVHEAHVSRIDFAHNFIMRYEPEIYYPYLGESQYFRRFSQPQSLYYKNGNRTKLFYNKPAEVKYRTESLPEVWSGRNVLRYEIRYSRRLDKQLKEPEIRANTLYQEPFYIKLVKRYVTDYQSIHKNAQLHFDEKNMSTPKDFWLQLALMKVDEIGQNRLMELVDEWRAKGLFSKPEYYSRLKKEIRDRSSKSQVSDSSVLIEELDKKVSATKRYYR